MTDSSTYLPHNRRNRELCGLAVGKRVGGVLDGAPFRNYRRVIPDRPTMLRHTPPRTVRSAATLAYLPTTAHSHSDARPLERPLGLLPRESATVSVSFASVQHRPRGTGQVEIPQVRTVAGLGEHTPADLESVLVATPREFEPRILRHAELVERRQRLAAGAAGATCQSQFQATFQPGHRR